MIKGIIIAVFMLTVTSALAEKSVSEEDTTNVMLATPDVTPPTIAIDSPVDGALLDSSSPLVTVTERVKDTESDKKKDKKHKKEEKEEVVSVLVTGTVSDETNLLNVTVNDVPAEHSGNRFSATVELTKGSTMLTAVATYKSGETASASITVKQRLYGFWPVWSNPKLNRGNKCSDTDFRIIHGCVKPKFFQPSARVYFDTGGDDEDEVDIFRDGSVNPTIDFAALYWPWRLGYSEHFDHWSWGPLVGVGISAPAQDSKDGSENASSSPVVVFSTGLLLNYYLEGGSSFGFEAGRAWGFTSDESFSDKNDNAWYVGLKISIPTPTHTHTHTGKRKESKSNEASN